MGGGAGGHMMHPYDLPRVTSGVTFLTLMNDVKSYLESPNQTSNVKIDGINTSFKLVGNEFAVDRGSGKEIDVSGVTLARINERFPPGHGMRTAIEKLLNIFNQALPDIQQELSELGLMSNPHFFLNTEYVEGAINAVGYQQDFIAIHGVKAFYQMWRKNNKKVAAQTGKPFSLIRQGLPKPPDDPSSKNLPASREVPYNINALISLIEKVQPIANNMGFKLYGPVPSAIKPGLQIDYSSALSAPFEVNITDEYSDQYGMFEHLQGRPIKDWLDDMMAIPAVYNGKSYNKSYPTTDGKRVNPYHRDTYLAVMNKSIPLDKLIQPGDVDENGYDNVRNIINGAVLVELTRTMGNAIINVMTSEAMGDLSGVDVSHEGVVIRDPQFHPTEPFKITGEFIVTGRFGAIAAKMGTTPSAVTEAKIRKMVRESIHRTYLSMLPRVR